MLSKYYFVLADLTKFKNPSSVNVDITLTARSASNTMPKTDDNLKSTK